MFLQQKGFNDLSKLMAAPVRRKSNSAVQDAFGRLQTKAAGIVEVFIVFYNDLYKAPRPTMDNQISSEGLISDVSRDEMEKA